MAETFIPNPDNKSQVNHKDGNKLNNHIDNLEWVTEAENSQHSIIKNLRTFRKVYQYDKNKELINVFPNIAAVTAKGYDIYSVSCELRKDAQLPKTLTLEYFWSFSDVPNFQTETIRNMGLAKQVYQYTKTGEFINMYKSTGMAAKAVKGSHSHIEECCRGKLNSYKGYIWRYKPMNDIVSTSSESQSSS